ncbi:MULTISPECIES: DUF3048 domain-containing protein [Brevibacillus]|uniref:DUF3048 domain-containing protein n=1 Tax=Brevibacillus TaxID=55080 RepID=UPI000E2FE781|nr:MULTISPECIES: DUF3048 domain-containing protein [Brevibacillus]MED1786235.1 DUF3048 domain-containing protein [Brevibacillus laterosporus]RFB28851.1 DUF3048 domain-containing protein [Brevibacillus sp. VP]
MTQIWKYAVVVVTASALLVSCNQFANKEQPSQPNPVTPPVSEPLQEKTFPYTAPLTGMGVDERIDHRPVMVMINNHPKARPQSGLDKADIVYEVLSEGEVTRFLAIFHSQTPKTIGPVRSIRPYFIKLGRGLDSILVHVGGSPDALQILKGADDDINEISNSTYFWREKFRSAPHNVYTDLSHIEKAMQAKNMRITSDLPFFPFLPKDAKIEEGQAAAEIKVKPHPQYSLSYKYDTDKEKYLRYTQGEVHKDLTSDKQLEITNVLVISSKHKVLDNEGRREVDVTGPGEGYLFQQGKAKPIKWARKDGIIRAYEDAALTKEIPLLPGNTWVNIVPNTPSLDQHLSFQ